MVEQLERYCRNCGHKLRVEDQFCANCGKPVQEVAHIPTPEANVPLPPPSQAGRATSTGGTAALGQHKSTGRVMALGCLGFIGLFVVLTFLIIVAAALGGGQQAQDVGQRQQDQPGQQQQQGHQEQEQGRQRQGQQEQKAAYGIADEVNIGNVSYTVTNAKVVKQLKDSFGFDKPLTGNFILITFTFANKGNKPVSLSDLGLYLYDSQGRQYKIDTDAAFYLPEDRSIYLLDRVNPGSSQEVQTVYSVPPDAKGFELEVSSGSFGTETARISLGY